MKRLPGLLIALGAVIALLAGCAGVPNSSSPQAIGTVERPAPQSLPKPTPGMEPDLLLREFLKATADPANRHLAARQFLTESASANWLAAVGSAGDVIDRRPDEAVGAEAAVPAAVGVQAKGEEVLVSDLTLRPRRWVRRR